MGSTVYNYLTQNGKVVRQTWGSHTLDIIYDNQGNPSCCIYDGTKYIYVLNLQGDVIRLVTTSGSTAASYVYDAWGNVISSSGTMAEVNPIRYRGYYYDTETKLYYLQSRYYDPLVKRFINADVPEITVSGGSMLSKNLFAYCENCPTIADDQDGLWLNVVIGAVVGGLISYASADKSNGIDAGVVTSVVTGAISGAFAATGVGGTLGQTAVSAVLSSIDTAVGAYHDYKKGNVNLAGAAAKTVSGVAMGAAFGAMGAEGTSAFKKSTSVTKKAWQATKAVFSKSTSKAKKQAAKLTLKNFGKYVLKTSLAEGVNSVSSSVLSYGATTYTGTYFTWATR